MTVDPHSRRPSDDLDQRLRAAAGSFGADVTDAVDVELALSGATGRRRATGPAVVLALLAAVALVVTVLVVDRDDDVDVAIDEQEDDDGDERDLVRTTVPRPDGTGGLALGAPDDGKESVGLPITVEPSTGLVDGQTVTVTGTGFPPNQSVGVVMCTKEAGRDYGARGVEACNLGHVASTSSDASGVAVAEFVVRRLQTLDGQPVDCADEPGRCLVGMGMVSDYDTSGGALIEFDPGAPLADPPTAQLARTEDLVDGETVEATVTGLVANSFLSVGICDAGLMRCTYVGEHSADASGGFSGPVRLWRSFGSYAPGSTSPNVDCAVERCVVSFEAQSLAGTAVPPIEVGFDPARGQRAAPVAAIVEPLPSGPDEPIIVQVTGSSPGAFIDGSICGSPTAFDGGGECWNTGASVDASGTATLRFDQRALPDSLRSCECVIVFAGFQEGPTGTGAPPLFPEPITVTTTG